MLARLLTLTACLVAILGSPVAALAQSHDREITREGNPARREILDPIELKPFPADWGTLQGWIGEPVTGKAAAGRPVLIVAFASWNPASGRAMTLAQRLATQMPDLLVVGVHHPQGWDGAAQFVKDRGVTFPVAHDPRGEFRSALKFERDPEYTFLDRSGQVRYAGVAAAALEAAARKLVGETAAQAAGVLAGLKQGREAAEARGRRTGEIRQDIDLASLPAVPPGYVQPDATAYQRARWPTMNRERGQAMGLMDQDGRMQERRLAFTPTEYHPGLPTPQGRAIVLYLWNPTIRETVEPTMNRMDQLQRQHLRDLIVVGALVPSASTGERGRQGGGAASQTTEPSEELKRRFDAFVRTRAFAHTVALDPTGSAIGVITGQSGGFGGGAPTVAIPVPVALIASSDGVVRWVGQAFTDSFQYALTTVLSSDPGVRARREADRRFIERGR